MGWGWTGSGARTKVGEYLDVHLVICGPVDGAVEPEANHEDAFVDREPYGQEQGAEFRETATSRENIGDEAPWASTLPSWGLETSQGGAYSAAGNPLPGLCLTPPTQLPTPWCPPGLSPCPPDAVARAAIAPAALHLLEAVDTALLAAEAAAWPVDEVHSRLRVYGEVQEEADHLAVHEDARLCGPCGHRVGGSGWGVVWPEAEEGEG